MNEKQQKFCDSVVNSIATIEQVFAVDKLFPIVHLVPGEKGLNTFFPEQNGRTGIYSNGEGDGPDAHVYLYSEIETWNKIVASEIVVWLGEDEESRMDRVWVSWIYRDRKMVELIKLVENGSINL